MEFLFMKNRPAWLLVVFIVCLATMAIPYFQPKALEGIAVGLLPRDGDRLDPQVFAIGDWIAGANGFVGLKYHVQGPSLDPEQWLRFTEGAGRASASIVVVWTDASGLAVGVPFEKPFKDDC